MQLSLVLINLETIPDEVYDQFTKIIHDNAFFAAGSQPGFVENWVVLRNRYADATITQLLSHDMLLAILKEVMVKAASESQGK